MLLIDRIKKYINFTIDYHIIVADAIAEMIDDEEDDPRFADDPDYTPTSDFYGIVCPPFDCFWVEATTYVDDITLQRGMLVINTTPYAREDVENNQYTPDFDDFYWHLTVTGFFRKSFKNGPEYLFQPEGVVFLEVGRDGRLMSDTRKLQVVTEGVTILPACRKVPVQGLTMIVPVLLRTLQEINKSVEVEYVKPTRQIRRKTLRKEGYEPEPFYLLRLDKSRKRYYPGYKGASQKTQRSHSVRGHFRHYSPERPLFGKHVGTFFIPAHVRGAKSLGELKKGYLVQGNVDN